MTDKPESETTAGLSVGEVLPVVAWRRFSHASGWHFWGNEHELGSSLPEDLTPRAPAQATIAVQAAEIERLKGERDHSPRYGPLWRELRAEIERLTGEMDEARIDVAAARERLGVTRAYADTISAELAALKAKQVADIDEVMRLADDYAGENYKAERFGGHYCEDRDAAREALRSHLAKDLG